MPTLLVMLILTVAAQAQTSGFTYQGRFTDATVVQPTNGTYNMQFALFDASSGGGQIGAPVSNSAVQVTNGVFTVNLDFGASSFGGGARFLEIRVFNAATSAFVNLTPRQAMTSAPYAIRSLNATTADTSTNTLNVGGTPAANIIREGDARLSDARTPTAGSNNYLRNQDTTPQAANFNLSGHGTLGGPLTALNIFTNDINANGAIRANGLSLTGGLQAGGGEIVADGGLRVSGNFVAGGGIRLNGAVTTTGGLSVRDNVVLNDARILLRDANDPHHAISYDASIDGIRFEAFREFQWVRTSNNTALMQLFGNGVLRAAGFNGRCVAIFAGTGNCNQDLAETFRTKEQTEPGDVVSLIPQDHELPTVRRTLKSYDEHLVGVVSTNPGLVFDEGDTRLAGANDHYITKDKTVVAAVGRVPVKFTLENGPINVGDPLTSSATEPGKAMKATGAGKIIGLALESSAKAQDGKLLMWLQVGHYAPPQQLDELKAVKAQLISVTGENAELKAQFAELTQIVCALNPTAKICKPVSNERKSADFNEKDLF